MSVLNPLSLLTFNSNTIINIIENEIPIAQKSLEKHKIKNNHNMIEYFEALINDLQSQLNYAMGSFVLKMKKVLPNESGKAPKLKRNRK